MKYILVGLMSCIIGATGVFIYLEFQKLDSNIYKNIAYNEDSLYAVEYLGYGEESLDKIENKEEYEFFYFEGDEYYLVVPRYDDMSFKLSEITDFDKISLLYTSNEVNPFIVKGNISDIMSNFQIEFTYKEITTTFSPYISLKDGSVMVGEKGVNITRE